MDFRRAAQLLLAALLLPACSAPQPEGTRPNIVLIIGDDHGWPDFGFMGSRTARTPSLDRLAEEGTAFTHAFNAASSCRPSLLTLLTGLHPFEVRARLGLRGPDPRLPPALIERFETLPGLLTAHGYATFQGGKWWEQGFASGGFSHGMTKGSPGEARGGGAGLALGRSTMQPLWDFLEARREAPFFVWFAPMLPHVPFDAAPELQASYAEAGVDAPYFANVTRFDARVGELLDRLQALGLRERTLLVYVADNGWDAVSPEPLRNAFLGDGPRGKSSIHELGFRTPLVVSWPGVVSGGRRDDRLVSTVDLYPTLLDFASVPMPQGRSGRSLRPLLTGSGSFARDRVLGGMLQLRNDGARRVAGAGPFRNEEAWFIRDGRWRYVWYPRSGDEALYRIDRDPFETRDLAASHPEEARRLRDALRARVGGARAEPRA